MCKFSEKNLSPRHTKLTDICFSSVHHSSLIKQRAVIGNTVPSHTGTEDSSDEVECLLYETPQKAINNSVSQTGFKFSTVNKTCNNILETEEKHKKCIAAH